MPAYQPSKREKSNGLRSRVSTRKTGLGVLGCVPPRSAKTGITGYGAGAAGICHSSGGVISVRRLFMAFLPHSHSLQRLLGVHGTDSQYHSDLATGEQRDTLRS